MVRNKHMLNKFAFSMIELIFAIVIIGITVISLPMMTQVTSKGVEGSLAQEAIFAASTELNQAVSYYWDSSSLRDGDTRFSKVVNSTANDCNASTSLRPGHINQPYHRQCLSDTTINPLNVADGNASINDAAHGSRSIFIGTMGTAASYKEDYQSNVSVDFSRFDTVTAADEEIKKITINITKADGSSVTRLSTYSANIGEVDYYSRTYQ